MKRFDLSVGQRLATGTIVIALLVAALGTLLVVFVGRVSALRREKLEVIAPRAKATHDLETSIYQQGVAFRAYAITRSPGDFEAFRRAEQDVIRRMDVLAEERMGSASRALFAEIEPAIRDHQRSFESVLALVDARADRAAIDAAEAESSRRRNEVLRTLGRFLERQTLRVHEADVAIDRAVSRVRAATIAITLLLIVATVATWVVVGRAVREPALELKGAAEALREGDFEPALRLEGDAGRSFRDEVREAARTFGRMAATLRSRERRLAAHSRISAGLGATLDPETIAAGALAGTMAEVGAEAGGVWLVAGSGAPLRSAALIGLEAGFETSPEGAGICERAVAGRRTIAERALPPDEPRRIRAGSSAAPPACVVATPMEVEERTVGVLLVAALRDLDDDEIAFIGAIAGQLAITLDNALAHARIADLARALQRLNEELLAQNEELQQQGEELQAQSEEMQVQNEELAAQSDELLAQQRSLEKTNDALQAAEAQKNRFLAVLGHELRNPLAAISSAVRVLGQDCDTDVRSEAFEILSRQTRHLARLLDDLLDLGRITTGKVVLMRRPVDLAAAAQRCVALVAPDATGGPSLRLDAPHPVWVDADETRLEQIVTNLLTNALKYTPATGEITVDARREPDGAVLRVVDTGTGIEPAALARVFDYFYRGEDPQTRAKGGLGIGLSLVKDLVELHGGRIEATSEGAGRGTTVSVRIPALAGPPLTIRSAGDESGRIAPRSIVIVEDNADVRYMMKLMLRRAGHTVAEAHDGPSGVDAVIAARPDVALVDLDLPSFDGCEVARRLRREPELAGLRLIAISGYGRPEDRARALEAGFDEHLVKPVDFKRLSLSLAADGPT